MCTYVDAEQRTDFGKRIRRRAGGGHKVGRNLGEGRAATGGEGGGGCGDKGVGVGDGGGGSGRRGQKAEKWGRGRGRGRLTREVVYSESKSRVVFMPRGRG
jgi:hypothetical protein